MSCSTVFHCTRRALRSAAPALPRYHQAAFRTCAAPEKGRSAKGGGESSSGAESSGKEGQMTHSKGREDVAEQYSPPSSSFFDLEDDFKVIDQMFAPMFGGAQPGGGKDQQQMMTSPVAQMDRLWAAVDVHENDKEFDLRIDVPGLSDKDINIKVDNGMLVIAGERKQESVQEDKKVKRIERSYGSFERRFRLPATVKESEIKAKLNNGVLNVIVPKNPEAEPKARSIQIEGGGEASQSIGSESKKPNIQETVVAGDQADA